ncbi:MAG: protein-L-isoaspartate(D-aspartate) O-methyltransferase [Clostridiaceae bacterium]|nr:protein-L-isoaspartate(D-aspartate) O-methyltransferase [Clostridiaceae bacterium]
MDVRQLQEFYRHLDRSLFLDEAIRELAGLDEPLPIGYGQTISQPSLVLAMTAQLSPEKDSTVLEIGTGSGYQTAFLAAFAEKVYTVERIPALSVKAQHRLETLGYRNVDYRVGDGSEGWPEYAPYDRIMVTAAASRVPPELIGQLGAGGLMLIPVGQRGWQDLLMITKDAQGRIRQTAIEPVVFVELIGRYGWSD